jgi:hypothetical protein
MMGVTILTRTLHITGSLWVRPLLGTVALPRGSSSVSTTQHTINTGNLNSANCLQSLNECLKDYIWKFNKNQQLSISWSKEHTHRIFFSIRQMTWNEKSSSSFLLNSQEIVSALESLKSPHQKLLGVQRFSIWRCWVLVKWQLYKDYI